MTNEPFLGITCHFLDPSWNLKTICLDVAYLPYPHTAIEIKNKFIEIFSEYGITNKIISITTDNGCNVVKAI